MSESLRLASPTTHSTPIGALRAWITVLVVAHHAVLAYVPDAPKPAATLDGPDRWWGAFPVLDTVRWQGFSIFTTANEMYFMALMFLLSGLFVWPSIRRKGVGAYLRDRVVRLGIPFAIGAAILAPIAYYPAYLQTGATDGWSGYWAVFTKPGVWTSGPVWFLWVLLAFDVVVAAVTAARPGWGDAFGRLVSRWRTPGALFVAMSVAATLAYLVLELPVGGFTWWHWGPFYVQTSRLLLYFVYFLFGIGLGAHGVGEGVLAPEGPLARTWKRWLNVASLAFVVTVAAIIAVFTVRPLPLWLHLGADVSFVLAGVSMSLAAMATFLRFARSPNPVVTAFVPCAYGVYLVHYPIVTHLQFLHLGVSLPALVKGLLVSAGALAISWGLVALLRRVPGVARVV